MSVSDDQVGPQRRGSAILPVTPGRGGLSPRSLHGSPQLSLTLARDSHSSGVSVWILEPSGSVWPHARLLLGERWNDPLPGAEGCVEIAIQALQTILGEIRGLAEKDSPD